MYSPGYTDTIPPMVSIFNFLVGWVDESVSSSSPASATFEAAARAIYVPILLTAPCVVRRVWWANGATTSGGSTVEVGIYRDSAYQPGAKIVSGSATQGSTSEVQFVDVTDTALPVGRFWIALVASNTSNTTFMRSTAASSASDASLRMEEASASPLPATATPVESSATNLYLCGFSTVASP